MSPQKIEFITLKEKVSKFIREEYKTAYVTEENGVVHSLHNQRNGQMAHLQSAITADWVPGHYPSSLSHGQGIQIPLG